MNNNENSQEYNNPYGQQQGQGPRQNQPQYNYPSEPAEGHQVYDVANEQNNLYVDQSNTANAGLLNKDISSMGFNERKGFVVKVYSLISLQLTLTFALTLLAYVNLTWRDFLVNPQTGNLSAFSWVCFAIMFVTEIAIFCCKGVAKKVPTNYICLFIFTFSLSVLVAAICGTVYNFYQADGGFIVLAAALLTLAVTLALTAYACTTKTDITMMGGSLWIISTVLLIVLIISLFNTSVILQLIISGIVIVCYGFYLIYDTQLIIGGKTYELSIDDYVIASMLIYIDIIVLFLRILQIIIILFGGKR